MSSSPLLLKASTALASTAQGGWGPAAWNRAIVWHSSRVWVHPAVCGLVSSVLKAQPQQGVLFELQLSANHMAHVWDHVVAGRALVPGVLFMEMAASCMQQTVHASSSPLAGLAAVSIPAPCVLPELSSDRSSSSSSSASTKQQLRAVLRCLVQQQSIQIASSSAATRHRLHLQAQPARVDEQGPPTARSNVCEWLLRSLPFVQAAAGHVTAALGGPTAAAAVSVIAPSAASAAAITGCADTSQLDALLQLAAVYRTSMQGDFPPVLQVPAAAKLYVSQAASGTTGSSMQFAAASVRAGLTATSMTADCMMQAADSHGGAGGMLCSIVGLQAKATTATALLQQAQPIKAEAEPTKQEEEEVEVWPWLVLCLPELRSRVWS